MQQRAYPREVGAILPFAAERKIRHARSRHPEEAAAASTNTLRVEPTEEEIDTAIKAVTNAKTAGPDGLPAELLKLGLQHDRTILLELHPPPTLIWRKGKVPQQ